MKIDKYTKFLMILVVICLGLFFGCAPVRYFTIYGGGHDPTVNIRSAKTIGFAPYYWTTIGRKQGIDEIAEKQLYAYCKKELERKGYIVSYIKPEFLRETNEGGVIGEGIETYPDLILTVAFGQQESNIVEVPAQSYGILNWWNYGGGGSYGSSGSYKVQIYALWIRCTLWSGKPEYMEIVWKGEIMKGSEKLDLSEKMRSMVRSLFRKKFRID